jgi:hypothetical protein
VKVSLNIVASTVAGVVILTSVACRRNSADVEEQFAGAVQSGQWDNMIAGMIRSNQTDRAVDMIRLHVALNIADLWRWRTNADIPPHMLEMAEDLFAEARPTIEEARRSSNFVKLPRVSQEFVLDYLRSTNQTGAH